MLAALMAVLSLMVGVYSSLQTLAWDADLYGEWSRQAVGQMLNTQDEAKISAYIGMDEAQHMQVAQDISSFMRGETNMMPSVFNEKEGMHMRDVRLLIAKIEAFASKYCAAFSGLIALILCWLGTQIAHRRRWVFLGMLGGYAITAAAAALLMGTAFENLFIQMHLWLFDNELWLMNPETDMLIRMMPLGLFERCARHILLNAVTLGAGMMTAMYLMMDWLVGNMIRRHLTERK